MFEALWLAGVLAISQAEAAGETTLEVSEPIACRIVRGFEDFDRLEPVELLSHEKLIVYTRPSGHVIESTGGRYRAHLVQDIQIRRPGKKKALWSRKRVIDLVAENDDPPVRLYLASTIGLKGMTPGSYEADLILHDELAPDSEPVVRTLPFKVVATKPRPAPPADDAATPPDSTRP
jgi:hypothetical protein